MSAVEFRHVEVERDIVRAVHDAEVWDAGVNAAFAGMITRQNAADVKRANPYRKTVTK